MNGATSLVASLLALGFLVGSWPAFARNRAQREDDRAQEEERIVATRSMFGDAAYGFRGLAPADGDRAARTPDAIVLFSAEARGVLSLVGGRLGPAMGIDLDLGTAPPYVSAYGSHLYPVGVGFGLGTRGHFTTLAGVGFGGISAMQRADLEIPIASRLALDVSDRARIILDGRTVFTPDARDKNRAWIGDELRVGIGARVGRAWTEYRMSDAGGYFFRFERVERLGTTYLGLFVGYELGGSF